MESVRFNNVIEIRAALQEVIKLKLFDDCPYCKAKLQTQLNSLNEWLDKHCEMGIVL